MHFLDRNSVTEPSCLSSYSYPAQTWKSFGGPCKVELRKALVELQGEPGITNSAGASEYGIRCAYCESSIFHDGHIEHFRRKNPEHFPELTFAWDNLFLSCGATTHCGHYKDAANSKPYDPNDLVKPDIEDPRRLLFFSVQGSLHPREGLSATDQHRANETIRVFNLNDPVLVAKRRKALESLAESRDEFLMLFGDLLDENHSEHEREEFEQLVHEWIQNEVQVSMYQPYSSAIRDLLT